MDAAAPKGASLWVATAPRSFAAKERTGLRTVTIGNGQLTARRAIGAARHEIKV